MWEGAFVRGLIRGLLRILCAFPAPRFALRYHLLYIRVGRGGFGVVVVLFEFPILGDGKVGEICEISSNFIGEGRPGSWFDEASYEALGWIGSAACMKGFYLSHEWHGSMKGFYLSHEWHGRSHTYAGSTSLRTRVSRPRVP